MTLLPTAPQGDRRSPIKGLVYAAVWLGLVALATGQANAQQVTLSMSSGSTTPGSNVALTVSMTASGGAQPAGLEWIMSYPADVTGVSVVAGSAATAAGKLMQCAAGSPRTCIVFGLNTTTIGNGPVAVATFTISASSTSTSVPITVSGVVVSDALGNSIPSSGIGGTITVSTAINGPSLIGSMPHIAAEENWCCRSSESVVF